MTWGHGIKRRSVHGARALVASRIGANLVALRRLLQWSKKNVAAKWPSLVAPPSFKRPVRALLFPPTCLRRMHLRLTILPSESALALLSLLIDFEIICC
jgi:hypothetical protein